MNGLVILGGPSLGGMPKLRKLVSALSYMLGISLKDGLELWSIFHDELDLDGNGHLDKQELSLALSKAGEIDIILYGLSL
jgi:hypothetical protein